MERLARQVSEARRALGAADEDWKKAVDAVEGLADAFESLGRSENMKESARQLLPITSEIGLQINSNRSAAVRETCKFMVRILVVTGHYFSDVANALMPAVAATAKASSGAIRKPGAELFARMSELTRYDLQLLKNIFMKEKAQERVCTLLLEQLLIVFVYWSPDEAAPYFSDLTAVVDGGLNSGSELVRRAARDAVAAFSAFWPDRVGELRDIPPQQRILLVHENPDSGIATALLERYADLADKVQKFQLRESKKNPVRPRVNSRRTSSIVKKKAVDDPTTARDLKALRGSMSSEVAASPDRSSEETLSEEAVENTQTSLADDCLQPLVEQPAEGNGIDAIPLDETTLVVNQSNLTAVDCQDDNLTPQVPPEFNGSQMYAHTLAQPDARGLSLVRDDPPSHELSSPQTQQIPLDKATGESGAQRSGVRTTSESRIPVRVPSRSSSIPLPAPRNRPEVPAPRNAIPPIEFSGLSVSSQRTGGADNAEANPNYKPKVTPMEKELRYNAGFITSVSTGTEKWEDDIPAVAERDCSRASEDRGNLASVPTNSEQVDDRPSKFVPAGATYGVTPSAWETEHTSADDADEISKIAEGPVGVDNWLTPTTKEPGSNPDAERPVKTSGNSPDSAPVAGLLYTESRLEDPAAIQTPMAEETVVPGVGVEASPVTSCTDVVADASCQEMIADDSTSQERQRNFPDVGSGEIAVPVPDDDILAANLEASSTMVAEPPPKGALERLQEVRQQYADLRSISKFDVRDFPMKLPPEVMINDEVTTLDEPSPAFLEERDFVAVGISQRTELADPERLDTKTLERNRQPREPAALADVERDAGPTLPAKPRVPSRGADARLSRRTIATARCDHSHDRSRESSRERRVENGEHGGNANAAVGERPLVRKKSIPNLLKGVRLKYEDKPGAQLQLVSDAEVPQASQDQLNYVRYEVPAVATEIVDAALGLPEFPPPVSMEETHRSGLLNDDLPTPMTSEPIAIQPPRTVVRATHTGGNDGAKLLRHAPDATAESPVTIRPSPTDTRTARGDPASTATDVEHAQPPRASPYRLVQEDVPPTKSRRHISTPTKPRWSLPTSTWTSTTIVWFWVVLGLVFGGSGLLRAVSTIRDTYEYHQALKLRIDQFEVSVAESHETVHKLEENYAVWSEYVRVLAEEDEANAVAHLEMIQQEVEKWQRDMKADLLEFRRSLSTEGVDAMLAPLLQNATQGARHDGP